jgi:hypothetical protein
MPPVTRNAACTLSAVILMTGRCRWIISCGSRPFTTAFHIGEMPEGFDRLIALAPDESHIVPGHDPLVMKLYPAPSSALEGIAVRPDVPPSGIAPERADYPPH